MRDLEEKRRDERERQQKKKPFSLSPFLSLPYLDDQHSQLRRQLLQVRVVDLSQPAGKHNRLDPLAALPRALVPAGAGNAEPERPRVARDQRLPELVAVVARAVGRVEQDLERAGEVGRVGERRVLGRDRRFHIFSLDAEAEVADAVAGGRGTHHRPDARRVRVPDAPPGAGLGPRIRGDGAREVVRLGRQQDVPVPRERHERARLSRGRREQGPDPPAADRGRVVLEADHRVPRVLLQGLLHELHQRGRGRLPVEHQLGAEEPVARVLAVRLREVEQLDVGRVALELVLEQVDVELDVLLVEGEPELGIDAREGSLALSEERDGADGLRRGRSGGGSERGRAEARERLGVDLLRHPVVHQRRERLPLLRAQGGGALLHANAVAARRLEALDERLRGGVPGVRAA